ncbi:hypothetical protein [Nocardia sp. NPDC059228]|uniref:hypothetical protein n=1 Tax=Nocardia sp. NPDC059228 TaxID=3346777 RepID=UPI003693963B
MTDRNIARLGQLAHQRRLELGLSQAKVAEAGGPSDTTQTALEAGALSKVRPATLRKLDIGLQWAPGSAAAILRGEEPAAAGSPDEPTQPGREVAQGPQRPQGRDWVDPLGGIHVPLAPDQLAPERINQLLVVIADLDVQSRALLDSENPAVQRTAAAAQRAVAVVSQAVAEWMGGENQLVELAEALSRLAKQSRLTASASADSADATIIARPPEMRP